MSDKVSYNKKTDNQYLGTYDNTRYSNIDHFILNYIDDSTNIISSKDTNILQKYITDYYRLLEAYYNANKLLINNDKTVLLVSCTKDMRKNADNIQFYSGKYLIKQSSSIKILGYILTNDLSHDKYINYIISKANNRLYTINLMGKYLSMRNKILLTTSLIISIIRYSLVIMTDINSKQIKVLNVLIHKLARSSLGYHSYKWSNIKVLEKCKWMNAPHLIIYASLCLIHKVNTEGIPKSILNMFVYNEKVNSRLTRTPSRLVHLPRYSKLEHTTLYRGLLYYNKLGEDIKTLSIKQFKTQVKLFIKQKMPLDRFNTYRDYI